MGCSLKDFNIGTWKRVVISGHNVDIAPATTRSLKLDGVVYKLDGKFKGFTGSEDAVRYHVEQELKAAGEGL